MYEEDSFVLAHGFREFSSWLLDPNAFWLEGVSIEQRECVLKKAYSPHALK